MAENNNDDNNDNKSNNSSNYFYYYKIKTNKSEQLKNNKQREEKEPKKIIKIVYRCRDTYLYTQKYPINTKPETIRYMQICEVKKRKKWKKINQE